MKKIVGFFSFLFLVQTAFAQPFTMADTLRGSNGPGRSWWDVKKYDLHVKFNIDDSTISGYNVISFNVLPGERKFFQIDLQHPLIVDSAIVDYGYRVRTLMGGKEPRQLVSYQRRKLDIEQHGNAWFVKTDYLGKKYDRAPIFPIEDTAGFIPNLTVYYHGKPRVAKLPPWDGGVVWKKDSSGNPWIAVACQGLGASVWYPCKDYQADEPDSGASMHFTAPDSLMIISNGRMKDSVSNSDGTHTITWAVVNPINNYDISPYIGKYVHFGQIYQGEKGPLTMDYWVLDSNLEKAKKQFLDAPRMMKAFEYWFGPYPFYEDGYKLVDAPYLGMEHQSAVGYGNGYVNGYHGKDLSHSGWGLKWDFIIVHESGHEWFGNNITTKDIADMWVHEGFTNYSETLFTEFYYGKKAATDYITGVRKNVRNDKPIIGKYGVNNEGSGDMYYKAGNMIHAIRQIINNDSLFRNILRGLNSHFYHQTVTGQQVEDYINKKSGIDFSKVFDQYLNTVKIPVLEYKTKNGRIFYRWTDCVKDFNMPVKIYDNNDNLVFIYPTTAYQEAPKNVSQIKADENFYIFVKQEGEK